MKTILTAVLLLLAVLLLAASLVATLRVGPAPSVEIRAGAKAIGQRTGVEVRVSAGGRGLADVRVELEQAGVARVVARKAAKPLPPWALPGQPLRTDTLRVEVGHASVPELVEGEAVVRVVAERAGTWLRHPDPVVKELRLPVRLVPPTLSLQSSQHYVAQGGSGVVVYRVGATATRDGVRAGAFFFPGSPLPGGGKDDRLAIFGVPWDLTDEAGLRLVAEDDAGNAAEVAFVDRFFPKPPAHDRIVLDDAFLAKVVAEIRQQTPGLPDRGSLLENYLEINRDLRKTNTEELMALAPRSASAFLWTEPFLPLPNAQVMSAFADRRTYVYQGRDVDAQTHLGFDLAVVAHTPVPAANRGVVLVARYFGIYGTTVVVDHGLGLATLYAHLSSVEVKEGQPIERGAILGRTGATGLAGGDHLHFTTLVRGLPVNPIEWWDPLWIRDRVASKVGPAGLAFAAPAPEAKPPHRERGRRARARSAGVRSRPGPGGSARGGSRSWSPLSASPTRPWPAAGS